MSFGLQVCFFFCIFLIIILPSQQHCPRRHHSPLTSCSSKSHYKHKTSPNNVVGMLFGLQVCFFFVFFFYLVLPPQQHCLCCHHSLFTSHCPMSHQKHKTSPNNIQQHCLGYKYVFFSVFFFFFYLFIPFPISLVAPLHQGSFIYHSWLVN